MIVYKEFDKFISDSPTALSLGKFDGLHRGHMLLMDELTKAKNEGLLSAIFTFDIPPKTLTSGGDFSQINTVDERLSLFEKVGVDKVLVCPFTPEVMRLDPVDFIKTLVKNLQVKKIIVGTDFGFGYKKAGNVALLERLSAELGYELIVKDKLMVDGVEVGSTLIRDCIENGELVKANSLLGYNYFVSGEVTHGNGIGHKMDIPTINIPIPAEKTTPPYGVYASRLYVGDEVYDGISNIGVKPTIENDDNTANAVALEMNIFNYDKDLYDSAVRVEILDFVRPERKFPNIMDLQRQIKQDIISVKKFLGNINVTEL